MNEVEKHKATRDAVQHSVRSRRLVPAHSLIGRYASALLYRGKSQTGKSETGRSSDETDKA